MVFKTKKTTGWREYQKWHRRRQRREAFFQRAPAYVFYGGCAAVALLSLWAVSGWLSGDGSQAGIPPSCTDRVLEEIHGTAAEKNIMRDLALDPVELTNPFVYEKGGRRYTLTLSLEPSLQAYVRRLLHRSRTLRAAVVVLNSSDGRILSLVSYHKDGRAEDLCLKADFPAASLFKIVSAAAAMEAAGFGPNKKVTFRGKRHTLYKYQLRNRTDRYTQKISFKRAFASSVNPVFGKLGIYDLGQDIMLDYAERFLFNRVIPFELPVERSVIQVPKDNFGLAEIASGFNKKTRISPLHAALIASVAANNGVMVAPWLVEQVKNESNDILYERGPAVLNMAVDAGTAMNLKRLMHDTVVYGTCCRAFRPLRRKRIFKKVDLGAKTGTINDETDRFKYDWLSAFAISKNEEKSICIAVLGVHGKILGIRANDLGRHIIDHYVSS